MSNSYINSRQRGLSQLFEEPEVTAGQESISEEEKTSYARSVLNDLNSNPELADTVNEEEELETTEVPAGKLQLIPGETLIGTMNGKFSNIDGKPRTMYIYYGNFIRPMINDQFKTLKRERYLKMLDDFLNSEEGSRYERPGEQEMLEAEEIVSKAKTEHMRKQEMMKSSGMIQPGREFSSPYL